MVKYGIKSEIIDEILNIAKKNDIEKVIIFGSRARGDYREKSDIDLAVSGGNPARFNMELEEVNTLLKFDIVDLNKPVYGPLMNSIAEEGKILYEKI